MKENSNEYYRIQPNMKGYGEWWKKVYFYIEFPRLAEGLQQWYDLPDLDVEGCSQTPYRGIDEITCVYPKKMK